MLRGINKQQIFEDKEGCEKFLWVLKETKAVSEYKLFVETFKEKGLSIRQVSRLTGVSFGLVRKHY